VLPLRSAPLETSTSHLPGVIATYESNRATIQIEPSSQVFRWHSLPTKVETSTRKNGTVTGRTTLRKP
jgi:hypothetical protein